MPVTGRFSPNLFNEKEDIVRVRERRIVKGDFQQEMETKRALGVDPGDVRVGLAMSDELGMLAHPLETVDVRTKNAVERIAEVVKEKGISVVVVGMPRNMDGSFGPAAEKSKVLIEKLKETLECPVRAWDERLTTVSAQRALREAGRKAKNQKNVVDQAAAQILLQSWLDAQG